MASLVRDFDYDSKDVNLLRVSLQVLRDEERRGVFVGLGVGAAVFLGLRWRSNLGTVLRNSLTLVGAASGYNLYTHKARLEYARLAAICNSNASLKLNEMMRH